MKNKTLHSFMSVLLVLVIVAAMAFSFVSCGSNEAKNSDVNDDTAAVNDSSAADDTGSNESEKVGDKTITVDVIDGDGNVTTFTINTDEEFLRGALEQEKLIEGEEGAYGIYIKVVNGITADYDVDGAYWALSKDGEYLMTGADTTPIADGEHYELTYTK